MFGLVGESGSGKSTTGRCILRLIEPSSGEVLFRGENVLTHSRSRMRQARRHMQIVFQDPYSSLNPRMRAGDIVEEPLIIHASGSKSERLARVEELFALVGLDREHRARYPHEFSGGQRQRIGIARALALNPAFIIADEAVSALDVSIQAQIVSLMMELKVRLRLTFLFIAHDLRLVEHICNRVAVMYLGRIVEMGDTQASLRQPHAPLHARTPQRRTGPRSGCAASARHARSRSLRSGCAAQGDWPDALGGGVMSPRAGSATYRLGMTGLLLCAMAATTYATLRLTFGNRPAVIHVRWSPSVDEATRQRMEQRHSLVLPKLEEGRTYSYALINTDDENVRAARPRPCRGGYPLPPQDGISGGILRTSPPISDTPPGGTSRVGTHCGAEFPGRTRQRRSRASRNRRTRAHSRARPHRQECVSRPSNGVARHEGSCRILDRGTNSSRLCGGGRAVQNRVRRAAPESRAQEASVCGDGR